MGSKTTQQSTTQQTTPLAQAQLQNIYNQVAGAASTPYTPYTGQLVAPVNGQQTAGINNINASANYASPYIQSAAGLVQGAANPLTASQIQQYENPYTQAVVNATQAQFNNQNAQAQSALKGNAAMQGAAGGDRQAVAQAVLAGQQQQAQAPVIANLESQGYNQAVQTAANQFQENPLAAASTLGNLGVAGQNAALSGAQAQIGAGTLQQQTQQAADQAAYQQYQAQQGFPYQQAAFLEQYGLPSALAQGTSSNGVQTGQGPNQASQYLGLGLTAAGMFLKDGGSVNGYAPGGNVGYITADEGYIPTARASASTLRSPSLQFMKPQQTSSSPFGNLDLKGLGTGLQNDFGSASFGGGNMFSGDAWGGDKANPLPGLSAEDYGYAKGGLVQAIHEIHHAVRKARHYDDGGDVSFADRWGNDAADLATNPLLIRSAANAQSLQNNPDDVVNPGDPLRMPDQEAVDDWRRSVNLPTDGSPAPSLPKEITNPDDTQPSNDPAVTAYAPGQSPLSVGTGTGPMGANGMPTDVLPVQAPQQQIGHSLFGANLSDKTRQSLIAAGLGLMASRSPFLGQALGEGGLQGLKAYSDMSAAEQAEADKEASRAQEQQRIDIQAKQLAANLENQRRAAASADLIPGPNGAMIPNPAKLAYLKASTDITAKDNWQPIGSVVSGDTVHPVVQNRATGEIKDAVTGQPPKDTDKYQPKGNSVQLSSDDAKALAQYYVTTGDKSRLQGLGLNGNNRALVNHAIKEVQDEQGVSDQELGSRVAEFEGRKASQRTLGVSEAKMGAAGYEAEGAIKLARDVVSKVPRTSFLPLNKLIVAYQHNTLSPDQIELMQRLQAIKNTYAAVMARGSNVTTDAARARGDELLDSAYDAPSMNRVFDTMESEIQMARNSPEQMRQFYRQKYGAQSVAPDNAAPATTTPNKPSLQEFLTKARAANPGKSDADLTDYYKKKYGG